MVRHEHVQHLSRADPIEHFHAKGILPILAQLRRQSLACRDAQAQTRTIERGFVTVVLKQHSINHRHAKEYCGLRFVEDLTNYLRCRFLPAENSSQAVEQRKSEAV